MTKYTRSLAFPYPEEHEVIDVDSVSGLANSIDGSLEMPPFEEYLEIALSDIDYLKWEGEIRLYRLGKRVVMNARVINKQGVNPYAGEYIDLYTIPERFVPKQRTRAIGRGHYGPTEGGTTIQTTGANPPREDYHWLVIMTINSPFTPQPNKILLTNVFYHASGSWPFGNISYFNAEWEAL